MPWHALQILLLQQWYFKTNLKFGALFLLKTKSIMSSLHPSSTKLWNPSDARKQFVEENSPLLCLELQIYVNKRKNAYKSN